MIPAFTLRSARNTMLRMEAVVAPNASPAVLPQVVAQSALLELPALELEEKVKEELEENPALELKNETLPPIDYMPAPNMSRAAGSWNDPGGSDVWGNLADTYTLHDDLKQQFRAQNPSEGYRIAELLIEAIDTDGYLALTVEEVAETLSVACEEVEEILEAIHELSPRGLGARSLGECLQLQLQSFEHTNLPEGVEAVIEAMPYLSEKSFRGGANCISELKVTTRLPASSLKRALEFIRTHLSPYPARAFHEPWAGADQKTEYVYPDVVLSVGRDDDILISIPQSERLALRINGAYQRLDNRIRAAGVRMRDENLKEARRQVREARQFIENLTRRHRTTHKVMSAIVERQSEFILSGPAHLLPLSKKEIAESVAMHEATVCRATKGKYVLMPDGRLEAIDIFFDDALPAKNLIQRLINSENKVKPLSDRCIQDELCQRGFDLARRTVTKYRLQLDIPSASGRRAA
jgi:RNA polymerase sigma-54 factor